MLDLSERIREYVDTASPTVSIGEVESKIGRRAEQSPLGVRIRRTPRSALLFGVVAVVVVVLVFQLLPGSGTNPGTEADAALAQVASVAAARPAGVVPANGQYLYYETTQLVQMVGPPAPVGVRQFLFEAKETIQTWVAPDGSGRQRIVVGKPELAFPADERAWIAAGSPRAFLPEGVDREYPSAEPPNGGPLVESQGKYFLSYLDSAKFPTQPAALQTYMDRYFQITGGSSTTFQLAGTFLQVGARPALRSALFQLIEHLRGVFLLGPTKDASGRTGTGVAVDGFGNRYILVFDPTTSAVLGEKVVSTKTVVQAGQVIPRGTLVASTTFGPTGVVSSISAVSR